MNHRCNPAAARPYREDNHLLPDRGSRTEGISGPPEPYLLRLLRVKGLSPIELYLLTRGRDSGYKRPRTRDLYPGGSYGDTLLAA